MNAKVNWQQIVLQLRGNYKPLAAVAREIGCEEPTLNRLARGEVSQPRFDIGVKLLELHGSVMSLSAIVKRHTSRWSKAA